MSKAFKAKLYGKKSVPTRQPKSVDPRRRPVKLLRDALRISAGKLEETVNALMAKSGEDTGAYLAWAAADVKTTPEQCVLFLQTIQARGLMYHPTVILIMFDLARHENELVRQAAQTLISQMAPQEQDEPAPTRCNKSARAGNMSHD
ncbi:MAG: hypothetical protein U0792_06915 [Gemmataceae bacterium]